MSIRVIAFTAVALIASPARAITQDKLSREVASGWLVQPVNVDSATKILHSHEIAFRQRLLPIGYSRIDVDALDSASGKVILTAGTELFRLRANSAIVECALTNRRTTVTDALFKIGKVRICLRDRDGDGRFEEYTHYVGGVYGLPSVNGRLPKTLTALKQAIPYTKLKVEDAPADFFIGVRYQGKAPLSGAPLFMIVYGRGDEIGQINPAWARDNNGTGRLSGVGTILLKGAELEVTAVDQNQVTVVIRKLFPTGLISIGQFGYNGFY